MLALWYVASRPMDTSDATYCYFRQKEPSVTTHNFRAADPSGPREHEIFSERWIFKPHVISLLEMSFERALSVTIA